MIKVISAEPLEGYRLKIELSNGKRGVFYVSPYLEKGIFRELKEPQYFRRVKVSFGGVMWSHEQDFSAETIEYELEEESPDNSLEQTADSRRHLHS